MIVKDYCLYCGECAGICPSNAIDVQELTVVIDDEKCVKCGLCVQACPLNALELE